ncbi:hypothetical protein [Agromyces archimandritae]|uniref:Uncharacterized protein n=1 Tax=Agromyces archimandritae TaxID=2781962 RepID=A0A975FN73_9MICO|nr:hypothetical protein [Agromyces archimandritae]QTX05520.1 hypothetical protein G127AT_04700 [Agromyces archimandritae]
MSGMELTAEADPARWITVPAGLVEPQRTAWLDAATATARVASAHWDRPSDELVPHMVAHALELRGPGDGLVLQYWPPVVPGAVLVRVEVSEAPDRGAVASELRAEQLSHVEQFTGARLGPGYEWVHSAPLPGEAEDLLMGTQHLFLDEGLMVLATLDATIPELFAVVVDEVRAFVRTLRLGSGEDEWHSIPLPGEVGTRADLETWPTFGPAA